jgi:HEAT repeats
MKLQRSLVSLRRAALTVALASTVAMIGTAAVRGSGERSSAATESQPLMWTGRWIDRDLPEGDPRKAANDAFAKEQKQRWQEAQARMDKEGPSALSEILREDLTQFRIDRKVSGMGLPEASLELFGLIGRASWEEEFPGRWDLLVDLRLEFGRLLVDAGDPQEFLDTFAQSVLFPAGCVAPPFELVPASAPLLAQDAVALAAPKLAAFRAELQSAKAPQTEQQPAPAPGVEYAVREALARSNFDLILELGSRAASVLEELVRAEVDAFPQDYRSDPLVSLLEIRELKGAQLILELWDRGGFLFKKRVIRAMQQAQVLDDPGTWMWNTGDPKSVWGSIQPPTLVEAIWLDVLSRLAADPDAGRDSMRLTGIVARLDALDGGLQQAMIKLLDSDDPDAASDVMEVLKLGQGRASVVPILEHALGHRSASVRAAGAAGLVFYARNDALRSRFGDEDRNVRQAIARSMLGVVGRPVYRESDHSVQWQEGERTIFHVVDGRDAECLAQLVKDSDAGVRELAVQVLFEHPELPIPESVALSLARDPSSQVRGWLAHWPPKQPADPKLLEILAQDKDPEVLKEVDERMEELATKRLDGSSAFDNEGKLAQGADVMWNSSYVPALVARLTNASSPYLDQSTSLTLAGNDPQTAPVLLRAVQAKGTEVAKYSLVRAMSAGEDVGIPFAWDALASQDVVAWARSVWGLPAKGSGPKGLLTRAMRRASTKTRAAFRPLLADSKIPEDLRFLAALETASQADAGWREDFLVLVVNSQPWPSAIEMSRTSWMQEIAKSIQDEQVRLDLIAEMIRLPEPPGWALRWLAGSVASSERALPPALASEILERQGQRTEDDWMQLLMLSLGAFEGTEAKPQTEVMQGMMANTRLRDYVFQAMGRAHLPEYLPLLENALVGGLGLSGGLETEVQGLAANALACYLSDAAAEILLKGLGSTTNENVRKSCFDALDTIRRYQDEKERWAQRKSSKQAQDAAIAELAMLLLDQDANVRAQAARSLGALGAVELLPKLVNMLKDPAPEVRVAAQSAIDALTAQKPAPPEGKKD